MSAEKMDEVSLKMQHTAFANAIPSDDRTQLLKYGEASIAPKSGLVHNLFEQQASLTPDAHAVQFETSPPLSFSTLNELSNQLARQIRIYCVSNVAIHMLRSTNLIVALLATLKAGAAYVILDPDAPLARKSSIIEDTSTTFILVDNDTAGAFQNEENVTHLLAQSSNHPDGNLLINQNPSSLAYIIYTSGSLGKPKGVLIEHQAACNGLSSSPRIDGLRQLLFYNPTFSAAQRTIWATLITGGCLCLATKENLTVNTSKMIAMMRVTSVDITPSAVVLISPDDVPYLRRMVIAGEIPKAVVVETWAHRVELYSTYGLSECTQLNSRHRLRTGANHRKISKSIDTTTWYILHPGTAILAPLLVPGELCLGGGQLARGYLNNHEETAKKFIDNPFGTGKLHRTGDLAVRHIDGAIEILGRIDLQVKINGQKVDPSESNSVIQADTNVKDSTVISAVVNGRIVLVAVIVNRSSANWTNFVKRLRQSLAKHLLPSSIPNFWVPLDELPRNANSKIDITAIREIVEGLGRSGQLLPIHAKTDNANIVLTANEQLIQRLWAKYLAIPEFKIGLNDSFISLGGSSLEAICGLLGRSRGIEE